ncbi:MAG: molybdopterin-binding protein [Dokdonella sp.]|uniref:molybdopterin-binding protein n=1 Tax=Dokdonella sp. TaxID=2291710 RepID=UPI003262E443
MSRNERRRFMRQAAGAAGALLLGGCDALSRDPRAGKVLDSAENLTRAAQHLLTPKMALAPEYTEADISHGFKPNGSTDPQEAAYRAMVDTGFRDYRLAFGGLVAKPFSLSLDELRALPSRTQITRHDCVEGWSAIGKWKGVPLGGLLDRAEVSAAARYVVFRCADKYDPDGPLYYESIDLEDAHHPQTILAYDLNDAPLPISNGAPVRVRIERQLGYKMAKYIMAIDLVESLDTIEGGKGGYWEDQGYEWYAGI